MESIFQDPCPTLNGTRRVTMPQVLTRRREPIALLAKRGHLYLQTQKLALVAITQEAEAHSLTARSHSHLTRTGHNCMLSNCTHRLVSHLTRTGRWVQLYAEQPHPPPRLILCQSPSLLTLASLRAGPRLSFPLFHHSSPRPKALRSRSSTVASTPRPSRSSASSTR